jgi:hypothetical protein
MLCCTSLATFVLRKKSADELDTSGFEQANRYVIMDANGNHVGYMAERESGLGSMMARQWFRTHRSFVTHVFDREENEVLRVCLQSEAEPFFVTPTDAVYFGAGLVSSSVLVDQLPDSCLRPSGSCRSLILPYHHARRLPHFIGLGSRRFKCESIASRYF